MRRVVITGMGIYSPIGNSLQSVADALINNRSGIRMLPEWSQIQGLGCHLGGVVDLPDPKRFPRRVRRTMGKLAMLGALAGDDAVTHAGLDKNILSSPRTGVSMGSTTGSPSGLETFFSDYISSKSIEQTEGTLFMKVMSHTVAANTAAALGIRGRLNSPCSACASSTQAIGDGFEAIRNDSQDVMLCGGAEELYPTTTGVFDILHAASRSYNDSPDSSPRPFDADRDGLVISEGAAVLVLEELEHAKKRGANILGEVLGYATNCSANHMTNPDSDSMAMCMSQVCQEAKIKPSQLDYVNAHATATVIGDSAECQALRQVIGDSIPLSSTKGHTGHTLAASGSMEAIFCVLMMQRGFLAPTRNLSNIDSDCQGLAHLREVVYTKPRRILTSSFAFGGVNASLIIGAI